MSRDLALALWAMLALALVGAEAAGRVSSRYASFRQLAQRVVRTPPVTALVFLGWMWLGWHLFAR